MWLFAASSAAKAVVGGCALVVWALFTNKTVSFPEVLLNLVMGLEIVAGIGVRRAIEVRAVYTTLFWSVAFFFDFAILTFRLADGLANVIASVVAVAIAATALVGVMVPIRAAKEFVTSRVIRKPAVMLVIDFLAYALAVASSLGFALYVFLTLRDTIVRAVTGGSGRHVGLTAQGVVLVSIAIIGVAFLNLLGARRMDARLAELDVEAAKQREHLAALRRQEAWLEEQARAGTKARPIGGQ